MLNVLSVGYPLAATGPNAVGGAEQILSSLDRSLVARGHRSVVIAAEGSAAAGELIATLPVPERIDDAIRATFQRYCRQTIEKVLADRTVDVIHFHGVDFYEYLPNTNIPLLVTIHLPPGWYPFDVFHIASKHPNVFFNFVSATQKETAGFGSDIPVIENGVDIPRSLVLGTRGNAAVALGRICPEKNFETAIGAAKR